MKALILQILLSNWPRKVVALITAVTVWIVVNSSITTQRTIPNVPVRIINVPPNKTVAGLLPSGLLDRQVTLSLVGIKTELDKLAPGDLEVVIDAGNKGEEWVADIGKRNLVSLNPEVDLAKNVTEVGHSEFVIKLSRMITERIPVRLLQPIGEPPRGYQFLGVWPNSLSHTVSGPEEQVEDLKAKGLDLVFDLGEIQGQNLDSIEALTTPGHEDEVRFFVPASWKRVSIPFKGGEPEDINDPDAANLHLEFVRKELLPLNHPLPIQVFFPRRYSDTLNPDTYTLPDQNLVQSQNGIPQLMVPLYTRNVSRLFLDVVRDQLELVIIAAPKAEQNRLKYAIQFINPEFLENKYAERLYAGHNTSQQQNDSLWTEGLIRKRFRDYMRNFELFLSEDHKLDLLIQLHENTIMLQSVTPLPTHES